jgi:prepilin-type N-terminal cleavage/methylation domain-containing protein
MTARIRARLAQEDGMTLIELMTTMAILGFVLTGIVAMFSSGLHAEVDMDQRFQAQQNARLALVGMRNDVRTACLAPQIGGSGASVTLSYGCSNGVASNWVTWCASSSTGSAPFGLYRQTSQSCAYNNGTKKADALTCAAAGGSCASPVFTYTPVSGTRPQVQVNLPVDANLTPGNGGAYTLADTITLRNAPVTP